MTGRTVHGGTPVLAIDGPAGSGKSTVARRVAEALGWDHLDTGAMYRCVAWSALERGVDLGDAHALSALTISLNIKLAPSAVGTVTVDGQDVAAAIRTPEVAQATSKVAVHPGVRAELVRRQRAWVVGHHGVVVEGRDIATVVFPDALAQVFLTASVEARAQRRLGELDAGSFDEVADELRRRDHRDSTRAADPLSVATRAVVVDTTELTIDEVVAQVAALVGDRIAATTAPNEEGGTMTGDPVNGGSNGNGGAASGTVRGPSRSDKFIWWFCRGLMLGFCKVFFRLRFEGREHLPAGPYILAPVHRSYLDSLVCAVISGRRTRFLGKEEMWRHAPVARLWDALGGIKIARGTTDRESMRLCLDALAAGEPLAVFPEGQRRLGPVIEDMFEGAAYMASRAGVPIVPVGIGGSERAMRPGKDKVPRPHRVVIIVGTPIDVPGGGGERVPRSAVRETTKRLRAELQVLFDDAQRVAGTPNHRPVATS